MCAHLVQQMNDFFELPATTTTTTTTNNNNNKTEEGRLQLCRMPKLTVKPTRGLLWSALVWSALIFAETAKPHQLKPHQWPYQWLAVVSNMCTSTSTTNNQQTLCYKQQIVKTVCTSTTDNQQTNLELQTTNS